MSHRPTANGAMPVEIEGNWIGKGGLGRKNRNGRGRLYLTHAEPLP